jgi:hypothetical protein
MAVNEAAVREFFELRGLRVSQRRKFIAPGAQAEEEIDFLVLNPASAAGNRPTPAVPHGAFRSPTDRKRRGGGERLALEAFQSQPPGAGPRTVSSSPTETFRGLTSQGPRVLLVACSRPPPAPPGSAPGS